MREYSLENLRTSSKQSFEYTELNLALAGSYYVCLVNYDSSMNPSIVVKMCNHCHCTEEYPILSSSD